MKTMIVRNVPEDLHRAFKALCVQRGVSMNAEIVRLIRESVKK